MNFELRPSSRELTLEMLDAQGEIIFFVDHVHVLLDVAARRLSLTNMDMRVSETLARRLGEERWSGLTLASMAVHAEVDIPTGADVTSGACSSPNWPPQFDADVALLDIDQVQQAAREPGVRVAITPSASHRNVGEADVPWYEAFTEPSSPYNNDQHPVLVWALYRVADGRLEQLGQADLNLVPGPAVDAWIDPANPPPGTRNESVSTGKGHLQLLVSVAPLGGGQHRYEYALMNHDFDAQIEALEFPLPQGIVVSNARFKDLDDDPANDWQVTIGGASIEWQRPDPSNALDWVTLFNFGFDANVSSQAATAILDILEPGLGTDLAVASLGPAPAEIFSDGFESGDTSAWGAAP